MEEMEADRPAAAWESKVVLAWTRTQHVQSKTSQKSSDTGHFAAHIKAMENITASTDQGLVGQHDGAMLGLV